MATKMKTWNVYHEAGGTPITFLDAADLSLEERIFKYGWVKRLLAISKKHRNFVLQKAIDRVEAPDGKTFTKHAFVAVLASKTGKKAGLGTDSRGRFDQLPEQIGYLCTVSEDYEVGVFAVKGKDFYNLCKMNKELLRFARKLIVDRPDLWQRVDVLVPMQYRIA